MGPSEPSPETLTTLELFPTLPDPTGSNPSGAGGMAAWGPKGRSNSLQTKYNPRSRGFSLRVGQG